MGFPDWRSSGGCPIIVYAEPAHLPAGQRRAVDGCVPSPSGVHHSKTGNIWSHDFMDYDSSSHFLPLPYNIEHTHKFEDERRGYHGQDAVRFFLFQEPAEPMYVRHLVWAGHVSCNFLPGWLYIVHCRCDYGGAGLQHAATLKPRLPQSNPFSFRCSRKVITL